MQKKIVEKKPENCTYASVSSLSSQIEELKAEIEKLKIQNLQSFERTHSAETILKDFMEEAATCEKSKTDEISNSKLDNINSKIMKAYAKHKKDFLEKKKI